ncbi:putative protein kinase [Aspergillus saccharolyticus JOP 1030-1]|uniref:Kinase-like protein n=1 Tax=Aspergillus saccharolyticus JOP 1030-1 TaxID=1450539 RepID=A0A318Z3C0_9EURO|nr:kinase-like protein [Aspergillus saccharolyticus JOP 1030-1]PYH41576.1 kinase-like protein [Aspergillus saccharolyticus JOP 1030-1]
MVTASLLEFYCHSRAADLLNSQPGSNGQYTRDSPEALELGRELYTKQAQLLSQHGVLSEGAESDELRSMRQLYRDTLDIIGRKALAGFRLDTQRSNAPGTLSRSSSELTLHKGGTAFAQPLRNAQPLESLQIDMNKLLSRQLPRSLGDPLKATLFEGMTDNPGVEPSRYTSQFREIKVLGRGSFGEVYHVRNVVDGQDYAIKKIPLSQRRFEQLQGGNKNHLETILKEIRTLAKLDHTNIVRYYSAWAEKMSESMLLQRSMAEGPNRKLAIVFEETEPSRTGPTLDTSRFTSVESTGDDDDDFSAAPAISQEPSHDQLSSMGGADEDIFTDGLSHDASSMQIQRRNRDGLEIPAVILHIQMSLHPISLHAYLNPGPSRLGEHMDKPPRRHCFHLVPSLQIMLDILSGVHYLHSKDIIHRDLKPANIFLSWPEKHHTHSCPPCQADGGPGLHYCQPRIGDFGLVADISHLNDPPSEEKHKSPASSKHGSAIQHVVGTEFYRPPLNSSGLISSGFVREFQRKVAMERPVQYVCDWSLDVYSLGIILFELLYPLNTRMERHVVLDDLTRGPYKVPPTASCQGACLPKDFVEKVHLGDVKLSSGETVADALASCIGGMLHLDPHQRWKCQVIQKRLQDILATVYPDSP